METVRSQCVRCAVLRCRSKAPDAKAPADCPTVRHADLIADAAAKYALPGNRAVLDGWWNLMRQVLDPANPREKYAWSRVDEILEYARLRGMKRLGIATCQSMLLESRILADILERRGLEVASVVCLCGEEDPAAFGFPGTIFCNPILQAEVLDREGTELNIVMGLCVGHDILFLRHSKAETTTLVVRDGATGNHPAAVLYQHLGAFRDRFDAR